MTTYGLTQEEDHRDPITGERLDGAVGALPSTSAPPVSGGTADVSGAPLSRNGATNTQAGGAEPETYPMGANPADPLLQDQGTPDDMIHNKMRNDPQGLVEAAEASAEGLKNTKANDNNLSNNQTQQLQQIMKDMGAIPTVEQMEKDIYKELSRAAEDKKITKKQHTGLKNRWKNIFNVISEDEMGLFLIDFGLRTMMAAGSMGDMAAIGAGGLGALDALEGRRQQEVDNEAARRTEARDSALAMHGAAMDREGAITNRMNATANMQRANATDAGYRGKDAWLNNYMTNILGYSQEETGRVIAGGESYSEVVSRNVRDLQKRVADLAKSEGGMAPDSMRVMVEVPDAEGNMTSKPLAKLTPDEVVRLAKHAAAMEIEAGSTINETVSLNRALTNSQ